MEQLVLLGHKKEDLLISSLVNRVKKDKIDEVIIATSATVEGQTTAYYIKDSLKNTNARISKTCSRIAYWRRNRKS